MKPSELSRNLRSIAAKIDASRKPDRTLVSRDLKRVLIAMSRTALPQREKRSPDNRSDDTINAVMDASDELKTLRMKMVDGYAAAKDGADSPKYVQFMKDRDGISKKINELEEFVEENKGPDRK